MELKEFQIKTLQKVKEYLRYVTKERQTGNFKHASMDAWTGVGLNNYIERKNGIGQDLPNFCLKIPTGGGKTFLAVKAIDIINTVFRQKQTGLILWVVPTTQIYNQTIKNLRSHDHPYRQHLDLASGGKTLVIEKMDKFTPQDLEENLVVLMLMLPSAARQSKETLKVFRDSGKFSEFFPPEDSLNLHKEILDKYLNLDFFGDEQNFWGRQIKTSLGNVLRINSPVIILDEGHKAYSETAQNTLYNLNPSIILELSATPVLGSNILVDVRGIDLLHEEMIKLDLHVTDKTDPDWKNTLLAAFEKRNQLENVAREYEANTNKNIRPICLIQVERTGKDQIGAGKIHSEEVKDHLIKILGVPPEEIAIKTSEKDELKEVDDVGGLMAKDCKIRYIITKQALQEGWDCAFAYVLTILTNPSSKNALTQLVGRILRQPEARKTGIPDLDESYVFSFQLNASKLLNDIRTGFGQEGLGDLTTKIVSKSEDLASELGQTETTYEVREKFKETVKKTIFPVFAKYDNGQYKLVNYEMDLAANIDYFKISFEKIKSINLSESTLAETEVSVGLSENIEDLIKTKEQRLNKNGGLSLDPVFITRQIWPLVDNPWIAYYLAETTLKYLREKYTDKQIVNNLVLVIETLQDIILEEKDILSKEIFQKAINNGVFKFIVFGKNIGYKLPQKIVISSDQPRLPGNLQKSLFEFVDESNFDDEERKVAYYLDNQSNLFYWYRNLSRSDYSIQGWQKNKVYPDFIFSTLEKVFVVETKGEHLSGNKDTIYKEELLGLCSKLAKEQTGDEMGLVDNKISYKMVNFDDWKNKINEMLNDDN